MRGNPVEIYMDDQPQDISDDAVQIMAWLQHNIGTEQFTPLSTTVTAFQMGSTPEYVTALMRELTERGYLRHLETELPSMGTPGADLQHYQLGNKIPGREWGNTPKSHFE